MNIFEKAARGGYRYPSKTGLLTTEQLFKLPLTHEVNSNLNDIAIAIDDERETLGRKSFVDVSTNPRGSELEAMLEIVKFVIADKQASIAAAKTRSEKREKREKILDAMSAAESRELGSKSLDQLKADLAALDD